MKHVSMSKSERNKVTDTCIAIEYPNGDKDIWGAVVEINGRYPLKGYTVNKKCKEVGFFMSGKGKLVVDDRTIWVKKGDQVIIYPNEKFYWEGKMVIFMPCTPAWYPEQHEEVE